MIETQNSLKKVMSLEKRINAFVSLGLFLTQFESENENKNDQLTKLNDTFYEPFKKTIVRAKVQNPWFTEENTRSAIRGIVKMLKPEILVNWTNNYPNLRHEITPKTVGVIMAGNIPLVGFHDFLSVLISGNRILAKLSSKDKLLIEFIADLLIAIEPEFKDFIFLTEGILKDIDAIIATGSNNSSRYFEYYFAKYPHIIRKNRSSVALITGNETNDQLRDLGKDIFMYYGLGCRNVSKIFIPDDFDIQRIFVNLISYQDVINHNKYANNFDYNRAVYLMNKVNFLENGFVILKEDIAYSSPISVINYERYTDIKAVKTRLLLDSEQIQCIVSNEKMDKAFPFGEAQFPEIDDYADGIDTMGFLLSIS